VDKNAFLAFKESEQSKIFDNAAFGYWKVTVERPLRLRVDLDAKTRAAFRTACAEASETLLADYVDDAAEALGPGPHMDFREFLSSMEKQISEPGYKLTAKRLRLLQTELAQRDESAAPIPKKIHKPGKVSADPLHGRFLETVDGKRCLVEYEPDTELRDSEQIPLQEPGGVAEFIRREVLPHAPDTWVDPASVRIGFEISFTRYFYKPQPLRTLEEIRADILTVEGETRGLLQQILGGVAP
jgi:type I restriction enzyme M protein